MITYIKNLKISNREGLASEKCHSLAFQTNTKSKFLLKEK
jgi:hypothetical protein